MIQDNSAQANFWSEDAGPIWVHEQAQLDRLFEPVLQGVLNRAQVQPGQSVLDIGCGTGDSTQRVGHLVGGGAAVLGVDISPIMLDHAKAKAGSMAQVRFACVDAATHTFPRHHYDHLISRFGVMFFADPVAAFQNMRKALKSGAGVTFATWGAIARNPWFTIPAQAAKAHLGAPPKVDPDAPGPFAFRDPDVVLRILNASGFNTAGVDVAQIHLTPPGNVADVARLATRIGPAGRTVLHFDGDEMDIAAIARIVATKIGPFDTPTGVQIPAEINFFHARA